MKKLIFLLTLTALTAAPFGAQAQRSTIRITDGRVVGGRSTSGRGLSGSRTAAPTVSRTFFEGERITGVGASSAFRVVLVRSDRTRAVVECHPAMERFLEVRRDGAGVVTVGLKRHDRSDSREIDRLRRSGDNRPTLTLYLPVLNAVRLSGATTLRTDDAFTATDFDLLASGAADIDGDLRIESARAKVQMSGGADIDGMLSLPATRDLTTVMSGGSKARIAAPVAEYVKLGLSGGSELTLGGAARQGQWNVSGGAELDASGMTVKQLTLNTSGGSTVDARVIGSGDDLDLKVSGGSRVELFASGVENAHISTSGASTARIEGSARHGSWGASAASTIHGERFALRDLEVVASGTSDVYVNVSGTLTTTTSSSSSVRYSGRPASINQTNSSVKPM